MTAYDVEAAIDVLARRQHGCFSREQAMAAGASRRVIDGRLANGRWVRLASAVYALPSHPGTWHRAVMAAVLAERDAVAGGRSAAVLHRFRDFRPGRPEIVVPAGAHAVSPLADVHRSADVRRTLVDHIPVLDLSDTLHALAGSGDPRKVELALDDLLASRRLSIERLQRRHLELRAGRRAGTALMRRLIDERSAGGYEPPQSLLETTVYAILDQTGMPPYIRQARLPWAPNQRVDALIPSARLIIEADGRRWHVRVDAFAADRLRDRHAARHGHLVVRYTYPELSTAPDWVAAEILALVATRAAA